MIQNYGLSWQKMSFLGPKGGLVKKWTFFKNQQIQQLFLVNEI
jgi:hypothetical protein